MAVNSRYPDYHIPLNVYIVLDIGAFVFVLKANKMFAPWRYTSTYFQSSSAVLVKNAAIKSEIYQNEDDSCTY